MFSYVPFIFLTGLFTVSEAPPRNKTSEEVNLFERKASEAQERPELCELLDNDSVR